MKYCALGLQIHRTGNFSFGNSATPMHQYVCGKQMNQAKKGQGRRKEKCNSTG
jgi:hypothetical protein